MMIQTKNSLPNDTRQKVAAMLNQRLTDTLDLYSHAKQAHWNVRGAGFHSLHELFDKVAEIVEGHADIIAERAGQLGGEVSGTLRQSAAKSSLSEYPLGIATGNEHIAALSDSLAAHGKKVREDIDAADDAGDQGTADMMTDIARDIDLQLWFVESHLEPAAAGEKSVNVKGSKAA